MSQHSQLAAGSGIVPADGQRGEVLAGPALFGPAPRRRPDRVATVGVEPSSFLRRAILWRAFGVANVQAAPPAGFCERPVEASAVVLQNVPSPPTWDQLLEWTGDRTVVVDVQDAAAMAAAAGIPLWVTIAAGPAASTLQVMCHAENRTVYPQAPAVEIVAMPPAPTGLTVGDQVHLFTPSPIDLAIRVVEDNKALARFVERYGAVVWGRERETRGGALISCPTPGGGLVTIMDLQTVDRAPEPSGSETPAIQILLSLLGASPATFGRFTVPHAHYSEFVEELHDLTRRYARFAAMERIGQSVEGRDLWLMKIARQPNLPVVLLTNAVHPYEWAPIYGVLRYLRFLLERLEYGGSEGDELLGQHQLWWVPSVCPDGFDNRQQQPTAINLNRNFPGGWEYAVPGQLHWGSFGSPPSISELSPISLRGPAPASQPETRAMMGLFDRSDARIVTLADFHENTGTNNFLVHHEDEQGVIPDVEYHSELLEGIAAAFNGRFFEQHGRSFDTISQRTELSPNRICAWLGYAISHGAKGCVVEATGGDCTHYRTVRRTEYAAQVAEQVLANELGRLYRNPWGEARTVTLHLHRRPAAVICRLYDAQGALVEESVEAHPAQITRTVPAGGCLRLRYED